MDHFQEIPQGKKGAQDTQIHPTWEILPEGESDKPNIDQDQEEPTQYISTQKKQVEDSSGKHRHMALVEGRNENEEDVVLENAPPHARNAEENQEGNPTIQPESSHQNPTKCSYDESPVSRKTNKQETSHHPDVDRMQHGDNGAKGTELGGNQEEEAMTQMISAVSQQTEYSEAPALQEPQPTGTQQGTEALDTESRTAIRGEDATQHWTPPQPPAITPQRRIEGTEARNWCSEMMMMNTAEPLKSTISNSGYKHEIPYEWYWVSTVQDFSPYSRWFSTQMAQRDPLLLIMFVRADLTVILQDQSCSGGTICTFASRKYGITEEEILYAADIPSIPRLIAISEVILEKQPPTVSVCVTNESAPPGDIPGFSHVHLLNGTASARRSDWLLTAASQMSDRLQAAEHGTHGRTEPMNTENEGPTMMEANARRYDMDNGQNERGDDYLTEDEKE